MGEGRSAEGAVGGNPPDSSGFVVGQSSVNEIPTSAPQAPPAAAPSFIESAPVEYRDKPWFNDISKTADPQAELWKQFANAQEKIGLKSIGFEKPPGEDATPEQIKEYHKFLGVPESVDQYKYNPPDVSKLPENVQEVWKSNLNPEFTKGMQQVALEAGITQAQFDKLAAAYDSQLLGQLTESVQSSEGFAAKQREVFNGIYGDKAEYVERIAKETAQKVIPANIAKTGDINLALHEAMRFIHEKMFSNDTIASQTAATPTSQSSAGLQAEIMAERARVNPTTGKPIYSNPFDPGYAAMKQRVDEMYNRMASLKQEGK